MRTLNLLLAKVTGGDPAGGVFTYPVRLGYWPAARLLVARSAPGQRQHAERDDERCDATGDRESERDGQVLGPAQAVHGQEHSAHLEHDDELFEGV